MCVRFVAGIIQWDNPRFLYAERREPGRGSARFQRMPSDRSFEAGSNALSNITSTGTLGEICRAVPIPVNAIGGLNWDNLEVLSGQSICSRSDMEGAAILRKKTDQSERNEKL